MTDDRRDGHGLPGIWLGHCTSAYLTASVIRVNCMRFAVLGASLVCAIPAGLVSPTFSAGTVASLTACLITGSNYRRDHMLKEDAMALQKHHKSLEEYVQFWKHLRLSSRAAQLSSLKSCIMRHCSLARLAR